MKIEVHSLLYNEAPLIPYFMRHYGEFADVIFYGRDSTDGSTELAESLGATVLDFPTNGVDDVRFLEMKNNCWKGSDADWVIICDVDEFVYCPKNLLFILEHTTFTAFYPKEWRMYSEVFPITKGQIYDEVQWGVPGARWANKLNLFKPSEIQEINYGIGSHSARPTGNVRVCMNSSIVTLHFHHLGKDYRLKKNADLNARMSPGNKKNNWGSHCGLSSDEVNSNWNKALRNLVKVI